MSIYESVYHELEKLDNENNFETLEDFTETIRGIHNEIESVVMDFIADHDDRADMFDDYVPIV